MRNLRQQIAAVTASESLLDAATRGERQPGKVLPCARSARPSACRWRRFDSGAGACNRASEPAGGGIVSGAGAAVAAKVGPIGESGGWHRSANRAQEPARPLRRAGLCVSGGSGGGGYQLLSRREFARGCVRSRRQTAKFGFPPPLWRRWRWWLIGNQCCGPRWRRFGAWRAAKFCGS